jgi:hypothetical protein
MPQITTYITQYPKCFKDKGQSVSKDHGFGAMIGLLKSGKIHAGDINHHERPLLWYAIHSMNCKTSDSLLTKGADLRQVEDVSIF